MASLYTQGLLESAEQPFNIIEEFAALSSKRKMLLCDQLFSGNSKRSYENTVKLLWPEADGRDMKKLEKFLIVLRDAVKTVN